MSDRNIETIVNILKDAGCGDIFIFGSYAHGKHSDVSDIDIAVKGLPPSEFFKVYGRLLTSLDKDIDLVDLDDNSIFSKMLIDSGQLTHVA